MLSKSRLVVALAWLALVTGARAQDAALSPAAMRFLREGPAHVLAGCDLWRHRCRGTRLVVVDSDDGESNDVRRHVENLRGAGLSLGVTFELPDPGKVGRPHPLIGRLEVTASRWPLPAGLRLGDASAVVVGKLGEPSVRDDACWRYDQSPDSTSFCFERDRLTLVQWEFFID